MYLHRTNTLAAPATAMSSVSQNGNHSQRQSHQSLLRQSTAEEDAIMQMLQPRKQEQEASKDTFTLVQSSEVGPGLINGLDQNGLYGHRGLANPNDYSGSCSPKMNGVKPDPADPTTKLAKSVNSASHSQSASLPLPKTETSSSSQISLIDQQQQQQHYHQYSHSHHQHLDLSKHPLSFASDTLLALDSLHFQSPTQLQTQTQPQPIHSDPAPLLSPSSGPGPGQSASPDYRLHHQHQHQSQLHHTETAPPRFHLLPPQHPPPVRSVKNNGRPTNVVKGFKLNLPDNSFQPPLNSSNLSVSTSSSARPTISIPPVSPTRSPRSAKSANPPLRSPTSSPRKRLTINGSRYSPPPDYKNTLSASSDLPPPTPPLPKSPATLETVSSDYFNASPNPSPDKNKVVNNSGDTRKKSPARRKQSPGPALLGKGVTKATTTISTFTSATRQRAATMAAEASRRAMRSASGTRPTTHGRQFSTDMRQASSEDIARHREQREQDRDRKAMLNRALQKAHTAVLLDNAYNYDGAIDAYREACNLLHQVLLRSTADEERRKLDQIRETYSKRINELVETERDIPETESTPTTSIAPANTQRAYSADSEDNFRPEVRPQSKGLQITQTTLPQSPDETVSDTSTERNIPQKLTLPSSSFGQLTAPMDLSLAPPPLSPRRNPPSIPTRPSTGHDRSASSDKNLHANDSAISQSTGDSTSWLGALSSTGSSERSSTHSVEQANAARKAYLAANMDDTEAEFDAALDAAVEAAYDDGFEPVDVSSVAYTNGSYSNGLPPFIQLDKSRGPNGGLYIGEADEEGRGSSEIPKDYALEEFDFGLQNKSSSTRDSDGSQFSDKTWHSSVTSSRTTQSTSLSTVTEGSETTLLSGGKVLGTLPRLSEETSRPDSIHGSDLAGAQPAPLSLTASSSVRGRRMSGQNAKQLKIETMPGIRANVAQSAAPATLNKPLDNQPPRSASNSLTDLTKLAETSQAKQPAQQHQGLIGASLYPTPTSATFRPPLLSPTETIFTISPATPGMPPMLSGDGASPNGFRPHNRPFLKKNKSSMSLKARALSVSSPDGSDGSVATPMSQTFSYSALANSSHALSRKTTGLSTTQTHSMPHLNDTHGPTSGSGNLAMFDADIHSPTSPGFPNPLTSNAPVPLEPCPEPVLLRPFWLLRCIYQTIAHPRGGYISTKLFVPRDVWKVKAVKIKAVDEKIAQFDLLTHALSRLNMLDTNDMQSILEEMQHFEGTLDHVQNILTKKLGHDVGVHGTNSMFKDAPTESGNPTSGGADDPGRSMQGHRSSSKSYLPSSWRKLRSKTSSSALSAQNNTANRGSGPKDGKDDVAPTMTTVPMTTMMNIKFAKRDVQSLDVASGAMGPNAAYMASLARLCDAVQAVDLIARQVEDPGLKGSSSVHVGLELCTRHASEFFGFFICRIVLADVGLLLDKYLKRGTEWVLA